MNSQILENEAILKKEIRIKERPNVCERILYRKNGSEVLKRKIEMYPEEESVRLCTVQKERVFHQMHASFFRTLEGRFRQRVVQSFADQVFWNEDSPDSWRAFVRIVQIFS